MKTLVVDSDHAAHEPPEARGIERDNIRLMVSPGHDAPIHATFRALPDFLAPGDLVVVNTSATIPAAIDAELPNGTTFVLHVSTELPGGLWMVEPRQLIEGGATEPLSLMSGVTRIRLRGGTELDLLRPALASSLRRSRNQGAKDDGETGARRGGPPDRWDEGARSHRAGNSGKPGPGQAPHCQPRLRGQGRQDGSPVQPGGRRAC